MDVHWDTRELDRLNVQRAGGGPALLTLPAYQVAPAPRPSNADGHPLRGTYYLHGSRVPSTRRCCGPTRRGRANRQAASGAGPLRDRRRQGLVPAGQRQGRDVKDAAAAVTRRISLDRVPAETLVCSAMTSRTASTRRASARPVASQSRVARWSTRPHRPCAA